MRVHHLVTFVTPTGIDLSRADPIRTVAVARNIYEFRRDQSNCMPGIAHLSDEPGWDILLTLFIDRSAGRAVSVSSAGYAAYIKPTSALRWISVLQKMGLVTRSADPRDRRRSLLSLTALARKNLQQLLAYIDLNSSLPLAEPPAPRRSATPREITSSRHGRVAATAQPQDEWLKLAPCPTPPIGRG